MYYTGYELCWIFFVYSVAGWVISTAAAAFRKKKFVDVGFLYGPWCPAYGFGAVIFALFLTELKGEIFFLFLGGAILSFLVTISTGFLLENVYNRKWWDYSRKRFQYGSYVNMPYTVVWGLAAVLCVYVTNPLIGKLADVLSGLGGKIIMIVVYSLMALDYIGSVTSVFAMKSRIRKAALVEAVSENLQKTTDQLGAGLVDWVIRHHEKAYDELETKKLLEAKKDRQKKKEMEKAEDAVFAAGCGFYKLACLFILGAFLGDITETIFCYVTAGVLMSRSSVVYGPFSIVWGLGCMLLTAILYQYRNKSDSYIFIFGTLLGGAYEYVCSVFTEIVFGTVFWDYSKIPFNLGGRINLLYCFFWGIAAVAWMRVIYPFLSGLIEKLPKKTGKILTWVMVVFMIFNMAISGLALDRYNQRQTGTTKDTAVGEFLDEHFPDERMDRIYPNAKTVKK